MNREEVWDALFRADGDRWLAALTLGRSVRTLNRYIKEFDLYPEMDMNGFIKNAGPPRGKALPMREAMIVTHIAINDGEVKYGELAREMYGEDNSVTRARVYTALHELRAAGKIGLHPEEGWFVA